MKTRADVLPVELWLSIFSYFEAHELFESFSNINEYFDCLLNSNQLVLYLRLKKSDEYDQFFTIKTKFHHIVYLQSTIWHSSGGFPRLLHNHIHKFIRLKSLKVHIGEKTNIICRALMILPSLEYLSLRCQMTNELFAAILSSSNLRICHLEFYSLTETISYHSIKNNSIQTLSMNISNKSDYSIMNLLLFNLINLKRLEISNYDYGQSISFLYDSFIFPHIQVFKLKWNPRYIQKDLFERLIQTMPKLKKLVLDVYCQFLNEDFYMNLIDYWYLIFIQIKRINLSIRGYTDFGSISEAQRTMKFYQYQTKFFEQYKKFHQITFTDCYCTRTTYINISMY